MATTITAGNATNGAAVSSDNTGILELKTGTGAGTTAISIATNQIVTGTAGNLMLVSGTAITLTNQTAPEFTGIPSWAKRITVMFSGVRTSGTSVPLIRLGDSGGVEDTNYAGAGGLLFAGFSAYASNFTAGFGLSQTGQWANTLIVSGSATITLVDLSSNLWVCNGWFAREDAAATHFTGGKKSLSATLDRVRITTVNGTDQFNAGTINILYE